MSKKGKEETGVVTVEDNRKVVKSVSVTPARIIDQGVEVGEVKGLPDVFDDSQTLSGFPPTAKFEKPSDCIFGYFVEMREGVGPNNSRLYVVDVPVGGGKSQLVAVWGATALDRLFDSAYPPVQVSDMIAIIYHGDKPTKRGLNPVKLFSLKVKRGNTVTGQTAS